MEIIPWEEMEERDWASPYGKDDVKGCLNRLSSEATAAATKLVREGRVVDLNGPLDWPDPPLFNRKPVVHSVFDNMISRDDTLDGFFPQASTQWDSLRHVQDARAGRFFNGQPEEKLGTDTWPPIVTRGLLADIAGWAERRGEPIDWQLNRGISADELVACLDEAGVQPRPGDVLLVRTGWVQGYATASRELREELAVSPQLNSPGLMSSEEMAKLLWEWGLVAAAADNPSLEVWPGAEEDLIHYKLLGRMGMPIGELFVLDELAELCEARQQYEFLFTSVGLKLGGMCGTPPNACAVL